MCLMLVLRGYVLKAVSLLLLLLVSSCTVGPDTPPPEEYISTGNGVFVADSIYQDEEDEDDEDSD